MIFLLGLFTSILEWKWQWQITFGVTLNELYASLGNYTIHHLLSGKWHCFWHGPWVRSKGHDHPSPSYCFAVLFSLLGIVQKNAKRYKCEVYYCLLCAFQTSNIETDQEHEPKETPTSFSLPFSSFNGLFNAKSKHPTWFWINRRERKRERAGGAKIFCSFFFFLSCSLGQTIFFKILNRCHQKEFCSLPLP